MIFNLLRSREAWILTNEAKRKLLQKYSEDGSLIYISEKNSEDNDLFHLVKIINFPDSDQYTVRHLSNEQEEIRDLSSLCYILEPED